MQRFSTYNASWVGAIDSAFAQRGDAHDARLQARLRLRSTDESNDEGEPESEADAAYYMASEQGTDANALAEDEEGEQEYYRQARAQLDVNRSMRAIVK